MKFYLSLVLALAFSPFTWSQTWQLNDVSILMALPTATEGDDFLLSPKSKGIHGQLFAVEHAGALTDLVTDLYDSPENDYEALRAVGVRIDPCFKFSSGPDSACAPVLRIVWQPLNFSKRTTYDAAVHTFYMLTSGEFKEVARKLQAIKLKNSSLGISTQALPLSVHPAFLHSKRRKSFNEELKSLILSSVGDDKLVRFTIMKQLTKDIWWKFVGREKNAQGLWVDMNIPRLAPNEKAQDFFNDGFDSPTGMRGAVTPWQAFPQDNLLDLVRGPDIKDDPFDAKLLGLGLVTINRLQNPRIHSPATMDCVHCHIAEPAFAWANIVAPKMVKRLATTEGRYVQAFGQRHSVENVTRTLKNTKSLRAFGYFNADPSISQRTINESAAVADDMDQFSKR